MGMQYALPVNLSCSIPLTPHHNTHINHCHRC